MTNCATPLAGKGLAARYAEAPGHAEAASRCGESHQQPRFEDVDKKIGLFKRNWKDLNLLLEMRYIGEPEGKVADVLAKHPLGKALLQDRLDFAAETKRLNSDGAPNSPAELQSLDARLSAMLSKLDMLYREASSQPIAPLSPQAGVAQRPAGCSAHDHLLGICYQVAEALSLEPAPKKESRTDAPAPAKPPPEASEDEGAADETNDPSDPLVPSPQRIVFPVQSPFVGEDNPLSPMIFEKPPVVKGINHATGLPFYSRTPQPNSKVSPGETVFMTTIHTPNVRAVPLSVAIRENLCKDQSAPGLWYLDPEWDGKDLIPMGWFNPLSKVSLGSCIHRYGDGT
jgi:hypothetical protein